MSFKFGLKKQAKDGASKPAPSKRPAIFGDDEEPEQEGLVTIAGEEISEFNFDAAGPSNASTKPEKSSKSKAAQAAEPPKPKRKPKLLDDPTIVEDAVSKREGERKIQEAMAQDASIYDYDAAYDILHAAKAAKAAAAKEDTLERRPKYMDSLLESAEIRKKDQLRARDKLLQREREAEGDEFADKEKFVTGAYKAQQEEARKAEAEEKKKQEAEEEKRRKMGMQGFHRQMLMEEEKRHQEAMEAAAEFVKSGKKPIVEDKPEEQSAADLAKELKKQGRNIILNDEGEVADKRQLLSAGLNVVAKPKSATAASTSSVGPTASQTGYQRRTGTQRAAGTRERQTQMIAQQIEQAAKRAADEEAEERRKLEHASKSRKTATDISSAKERYLQRKREAAAAKAAANGT